MDKDIKNALDKFLVELKKDIFFFGGCGAVVALFMVWQARFNELGLAKNPNWANELFSDFMSFNAFGLIFFGYLLLACIANAFSDLGYSLPKLENAVSHMEARLMQIASSIIAFMSGLLTLVILYSVLNFDGGGGKLIGLAIIFAIFIFGSLTMALMIGQRSEPYNKWWVSIASFIAISCLLGWLLIQGSK